MASSRALSRSHVSMLSERLKQTHGASLAQVNAAGQTTLHSLVQPEDGHDGTKDGVAPGDDLPAETRLVVRLRSQAEEREGATATGQSQGQAGDLRLQLHVVLEEDFPASPPRFELRAAATSGDGNEDHNDAGVAMLLEVLDVTSLARWKERGGSGMRLWDTTEEVLTLLRSAQGIEPEPDNGSTAFGTAAMHSGTTLGATDAAGTAGASIEKATAARAEQSASGASVSERRAGSISANGVVMLPGVPSASFLHSKLSALSSDDLLRLLRDDAALADEALRSDMNTAAVEMIADIERGNQELARLSLEVESRAAELRNQQRIIKSGDYSHVQGRYREAVGRQERVLQRLSPQSILAALEQSIHAADKESEEILAEMDAAGDEGNVDPKLIARYKAARVSFHRRELMRGGFQLQH